MGVVDVAASVVQLIDSVDLPLAHPTDIPHQEPAPMSEDKGTSPLIVGGGVLLTLALTGGLIWVRERTRRADESAALEGHADPQTDEQHTGRAVEPGDDARPGQEPA